MSWKDVVGYMVSGEDGDRLYGAALYTYSANLCLSNHLSEDKVKLLQSELLDYERKVEYLYKFKEALYFSLVICLRRIQRANALRRKVIKSFRKNTQKEYKNLIFLLVED